MENQKPVAVVAGAGPGNGAALARRFSGAGYATAILSRHHPTLTPIENDGRKHVRAHQERTRRSQRAALQRGIGGVRRRRNNHAEPIALKGVVVAKGNP
jgi:NAD(P)-dependent dehydrogenase (short-subunit alcohol dehydrogenase family)